MVKSGFSSFPRDSSVSPEYADKRVAMEVEALQLGNRLGLGPFILMSFTDGICLNDLFGENGSRLLSEGVPDADIEKIYRQVANFMLQFFKNDFDQIGSLPTLRAKFAALRRSLTWEAHETLE
ncbi:hypothetical protein BBP40_003518 [Aspergillus hancockii]|nr:hypothetical protein BBP40_003518 [Aspergillus hancockii]